MVLALALGIVGFSGCKKAQEAQPSPQIGGVTVDTPKLLQAFNHSDPELIKTANDVSSNVRYGEYMKALEGLDKLSNDPKLTDAQKKVVADVINQVKQLASTQAPPAGQ